MFFYFAPITFTASVGSFYHTPYDGTVEYLTAGGSSLTITSGTIINKPN